MRKIASENSHMSKGVSSKVFNEYFSSRAFYLDKIIDRCGGVAYTEGEVEPSGRKWGMRCINPNRIHIFERGFRRDRVLE